MSNATQSRSQPLPRRFPAWSINEAVRVIEEARTRNPILAAKEKHIDMVLAGLARHRPSRGL